MISYLHMRQRHPPYISDEPRLDSNGALDQIFSLYMARLCL